ncbi:MAG TPA: fimbrial assembly protein, partial [Burkholderiaceae bacterium]
QDNRTYADVSTSIKSPCNSASLATLNSSLKYFTISCTYDASSYTLTATGNSTTYTAKYTVNQANSMTSTTPTTWGATTYSCWITRKGDSC